MLCIGLAPNTSRHSSSLPATRREAATSTQPLHPNNANNSNNNSNSNSSNNNNNNWSCLRIEGRPLPVTTRMTFPERCQADVTLTASQTTSPSTHLTHRITRSPTISLQIRARMPTTPLRLTLQLSPSLPRPSGVLRIIPRISDREIAGRAGQGAAKQEGSLGSLWSLRV